MTFEYSIIGEPFKTSYISKEVFRSPVNRTNDDYRHRAARMLQESEFYRREYAQFLKRAYLDILAALTSLEKEGALEVERLKAFMKLTTHAAFHLGSASLKNRDRKMTDERLMVWNLSLRDAAWLLKSHIEEFIEVRELNAH